jgi:hypothetical protein
MAYLGTGCLSRVAREFGAAGQTAAADAARAGGDGRWGQGYGASGESEISSVAPGPERAIQKEAGLETRATCI